MRIALLALIFSLQATSHDYVNVKDYPSFDAAAQAAIPSTGGSLYGHVYVPPGWYIKEIVTTPAVWHIAPGVEFSGENFPRTNADDLSHLPGSIYKEDARGLNTSWTLGGADWHWIADIRKTIVPNSTLNVVSPDGRGAMAAYTRTAPRQFASQSAIGVQSYCTNDNDLYRQPCYAHYAESIRYPGAGATFGAEINVTNYGPWDGWQRVVPSGIYGDDARITVGLWLAGAAGNGPLHKTETVSMSSAAIAVVPGASGVGFDAGLVCTNAALANSANKECVRLGVGQTIMWHSGGYNPKAWVTANADGELIMSLAGGKEYRFTAEGIVLPSGRVLN